MTPLPGPFDPTPEVGGPEPSGLFACHQFAARLAEFHDRHRDAAPAALAALQEAATSGGNVFDALMDAVRVCSLGQISEAFFEVGGQYRRNV